MQYSYGIIPVLKTDFGYRVLLVQHHGGLHWSFPKGHIEYQETPLLTAKREVFEETGISNIDIIPNLYFDHYYSFFDNMGGLIRKKVGFFVGYVYDDRIVLQKEELKDFCWKELEDANRFLTFDSDKQTLKKIGDYLKLGSQKKGNHK